MLVNVRELESELQNGERLLAVEMSNLSNIVESILAQSLVNLVIIMNILRLSMR